MKEDLAFNKLILVSQRYCDALFELAKNDEDLNLFKHDLNVVEETFKENKEFLDVMEHPTISKADKKDIMNAVFEGKVAQNILNFLDLLVDRNRMFAFFAIVHLFNNKFNKKRNIMCVEVVSAIEIDDEIKNKLIRKLESIYQKNVCLDVSTDKDIIAGMILKIGDNVIDGSVRTKLEKMKRQLI
ncbi:MAG TPA: ATP synthase F1 subunit delta [Candidatus Adamsella sp.]|nr:ATP synthase F1 subunit delta [Candidatus Adamsella sp.]